MSKPETALTKREQAVEIAAGAGTIHDVRTLQSTFRRASEVAIVLAPSLHIPALPPMTAVAINAVIIDTEDNHGEVYQDRGFCKPDEVALTKPALLKIMAAAGISVVRPPKVKTLHQYHWRASVTLRGRGMNGLWITQVGTKEIDLRDGAPDSVKPEWVDKQRTGRTIPLDATALANARRHGVRNCETKAILAALRNFPGLGIKQKYPRAELATKPFLVPCLVPEFDSSDPEQKRAMIAMALGSAQALYGAPALPPGSPGGAPLDVQATVVEAEPEDDTDTEDTDPPGTDSEEDDTADLEALPDKPVAKPEPVVCCCPCSHQVEITTEFAATTRAKLGIALCVKCVPAARFDDEAHSGLRRLSFPKMRHLEPIEAALESAREQRAKKGAGK